MTHGSRNVVADLGLPNPEVRLPNPRLAMLIRAIIQERELIQRAAGKPIVIDQLMVPRILRGRLTGYSTQRLMEFLRTLGRDVEVVERPPPRSRKRGRLHVAAA